MAWTSWCWSSLDNSKVYLHWDPNLQQSNHTKEKEIVRRRENLPRQTVGELTVGGKSDVVFNVVSNTLTLHWHHITFISLTEKFPLQM